MPTRLGLTPCPSRINFNAAPREINQSLIICFRLKVLLTSLLSLTNRSLMTMLLSTFSTVLALNIVTLQPLFTRECSFTFEELHSHLLAHDDYIHREASNDIQVPTANFAQRHSKQDGLLPTPSNGRGNSFSRPIQNNASRGHAHFSHKTRGYNPRGNINPPRCQYCSYIGHNAKYCPRIMQNSNTSVANYASAPNSMYPSWVFDTGASHHVTTNLNNMHIHSKYDVPEEVHIGDGTGLQISHIGSTKLCATNTVFNLHNVLYVPRAKYNLISVSKFCKSNNTYIEFHPYFFYMKDHATGAILMHGPSNGDLYTYTPTSSPSPTSSSSSLWHARFGHPSSKTLAKMM